MKTTQYVRQERVIASADRGGIYERWHWGLRLLRDPEAFASGSSQLRPGKADELIGASNKAGLKLSATEIRLRLTCARAYETEAQIQQISVEFDTWSGLVSAGFPPVDRAPDDPLADHRTKQERARDNRRQLARSWADNQMLLPFPVDEFEPELTPLKDLVVYAEDQDRITAGFVKAGQKRHAYLDKLIAAAEQNLEISWAEAHARAVEAGLIEVDPDEDDSELIDDDDTTHP